MFRIVEIEMPANTQRDFSFIKNPKFTLCCCCFSPFQNAYTHRRRNMVYVHSNQNIYFLILTLFLFICSNHRIINFEMQHPGYDVIAIFQTAHFDIEVDCSRNE